MTPQSRRIDVNALARVEGEGALHVEVDGGQVTYARLQIYEPPRFFEGLLCGRRFTEPPDLTARICGICPVAYQLTACQAIEDACGVTVDAAIAELRRLLYCGEWIASHALHIHMLHAPDFLGYDGVPDLARDHRAEVERGIALRKAGNDIMETIGGRTVHPIDMRLGGFYRTPTRAELEPLAARLRIARDLAVDAAAWVATFDFPDVTYDHELMALSEPGTYAIEHGTPTTTRGLSFPVARFDEHVIEDQVPHSTALHARLVGRGHYLTGPLARYAINHQWLSPLAREVAGAAGLDPAGRNPYRSIIVRAVELVYAIDESLRLIEQYEQPQQPAVPVEPRAGTGFGATEAPRGLLYHRYTIGADGIVIAAGIVPPTSQNQASIEDEMVGVVQAGLTLPHDQLARECERAIRNHDPCISCATHFLDLTLGRRRQRTRS